MHAVIYRFEIKEGQAKAFLEGWLGLTKLIYQYEGSLGSRAHKVSQREYIAYAQWPSKDIFDKAGSKLPSEEADKHRKKMKDACDQIETLYEMEMVEDHLQTNPFIG